MKKKLIDNLKEEIIRLTRSGEVSLQPVPLRVNNRFGRNF